MIEALMPFPRKAYTYRIVSEFTLSNILIYIFYRHHLHMKTLGMYGFDKVPS